MWNKIRKELWKEIERYTRLSSKENMEYGGLICEIDGGLHIEMVKGTPNEVEIPEKCRKGKPIADFHTHPNTISLFSGDDMKEMKERNMLGIVSALIEYYDEDDNEVGMISCLCYDPRNNKKWRFEGIR